MKGWNCVSNFKSDFEFKLDSDFAKLSTSTYMSIIQSIASLVNVTKDRINIKALKSGSVVVNGEITSQTAT